ncbi:MAG: hypothetical protein AAB116_02120 [Candidatus Poribacteria bacterium]
MKKKDQEKNSVNMKKTSTLSDIFRLYGSMFVLTHKNVGALRMIAAYYFMLYAFISLSFTLWVPVTSEFMMPTSGEKLVSRLLSGGMIIINVIAYTIMIAWKQGRSKMLILRILFIAFVLYLNVSLISRILYLMIREGNLF